MACAFHNKARAAARNSVRRFEFSRRGSCRGFRDPPGSSSLTGPASLVVFFAFPVGVEPVLLLLFFLDAAVIAIVQHAPTAYRP
jgi:hypothetical protein